MAQARFTWEEAEVWIDSELKRATDLVCAEQDWETTVGLRAKIKVLKQLRGLPMLDLNKGRREREDDDDG